MPSARFALPVEELRLLSRVGDALGPHISELAAGWQRVLEATATFHERLFDSEELSQLSQRGAEELIGALRRGEMYRAPEMVKGRGAQFAQQGLGDRSLVDSLAAWQELCLPLVAQVYKDANQQAHALTITAKALSRYAGLFTEGFLAASRGRILDAQDEMIVALEQSLREGQARLARRTVQLQAAAEISRAASSTLDLDELLSHVVELARERFDLYYAGVFLMDEYGEWAVLRAGTGETGRRMLEQGHKLRVGGESMIGWCTAHGLPRIALDVGTEAVRFDNPLLPETRSELALPLIARGRVIGATTVQSSRVAAFSDEDVITLQTMAGQLANAVENARLFAAAKARAEEVEAMHRRYLREEWSRFLAEEKTGRRTVYAYEQATAATTPAIDVWMPEIERAVREGSVVAVPDTTADPTPKMAGRAALAAPITLRGEIIGALSVYEVEQERQWSEDDIALVEAVSAQVAMAIENARLFEEIRHTAERLRELDRLKTQFLANMSHELRTPLNSIIGFSRVILKGIDGPLTDVQRTDLQAIYDSGQHLLSLINNILDLSKIEAGRMEIIFEDVDLREIIEGVMSTAVALVKGKPIRLQQSIAPDLPMVHGDPRRIRQVLVNLVGNATKFTEEGFIRVEAKANPTEVTIIVADSGAGIEPDKLETVFEPFMQVDASTTRRAGGTGLGLSITKHFVAMHGGRIWVESTPGEGSTFYVTLPIEPPPVAHEASEEPALAQSELEPGSDQRLVLCVDDNEGVITLFRRYLGRQGYRVIGLTDGTVAVERARQLNPFAITLDVMMPNRDGWQIMRELKADPTTRHIPVIMCTIASDKEYGLSLGASDYLIKPIIEENLVAALERIKGG
jgi:signal transduction histidine kinase/CheY-like chemotaxis protein/putative methionine-R-sulfoxide reductase with GAF domain